MACSSSSGWTRSSRQDTRRHTQPWAAGATSPASSSIDSRFPCGSDVRTQRNRGMQTPDVTANPSTADTLLGVFSWLVIIFAALWLLMSIIGYFHRRAYNLTLAESGGRPIKPDFLKVDKKRRKDAIERGEEYDEVLEKRAQTAAAAAAPSAAVRRLGTLSRACAVITGSLTLVAAIVGTVSKVKLLETDIQEL